MAMSAASEGRFRMRYEAHFGDRVFRCFAERPGSVMAMLEAAVASAPDGDAAVFQGERLSYRELGHRAERVAANLAARGINAGDRVGVLVGNSLEFVISVFGTLRLGAIAVPLSTREQREGLSFVLDNCAASALIYDAELADKVPTAAAVPSVRQRFVVGEPSGAEPFTALLDPAAPVPPPEVGEEETAVILYTSGTTGRPKGAMLTHLNLVHSVMHFEHSMDLRPGERSMLAVPGSHVTGLVAILLTMVRMAGCTIIMRSFDAQQFLRLVAEERATHTIMVPAMYNLCLLRGDFASLDLSRWRIGGFGGAPMPEATIARFHDKLPNLQLINAYGATETTSPTTVMPAEATAKYPDSVGRPVACADVRIMDDYGREVAPGETGELWIAGPMVVPGYWNNPRATADNFIAGYWRSGDVGSLDAQGFVRLFDRKKDMIIRGGYNIYSVELENVLHACPGVAECGVVGRPDPVLGEKIHVFVSSSDPTLTEERIKRFCAERLADYKIPDFVTIQSDSLPRNANGKLIKRALRERATAG
jgi:long-chain acyl-CoA synthetase